VSIRNIHNYENILEKRNSSGVYLGSMGTNSDNILLFPTGFAFDHRLWNSRQLVVWARLRQRKGLPLQQKRVGKDRLDYDLALLRKLGYVRTVENVGVSNSRWHGAGSMYVAIPPQGANVWVALPRSVAEELNTSEWRVLLCLCHFGRRPLSITIGKLTNLTPNMIGIAIRTLNWKGLVPDRWVNPHRFNYSEDGYLE
jgi:hypothetical protein